MTVNIGDVIFVKTAKGQQEILARTFGLASRLRRALILVDGQKAGRSLAALLPGLEADALLIELQAQGFIELRSGDRAAQRSAPRQAAPLVPPPPPTFVAANPAAPARIPAAAIAPASAFAAEHLSGDEVIEAMALGSLDDLDLELDLEPAAAPIAPEPAATGLDAQMIAQAQSLMVESASQLLGLMARPLIAEIEAVKDAAGLKRVIARWNMSLRQSRKPPEQIDRYVLAVKTLVGI